MTVFGLKQCCFLVCYSEHPCFKCLGTPSLHPFVAFASVRSCCIRSLYMLYVRASFHVSLGILCVSSDRKCSQEGRSGCLAQMFLFQNLFCCCIVSSDRCQQKKIFMLFGLTVILMSNKRFSVDVWTKLVCPF